MKKIKQNYKIAYFRSAYDRVNFINRDFQGHTRYERLRVDLRMRYADALRELEAMIPALQARYADDLEMANSAIKRANIQIDRNETEQVEAIKNDQDGEIFNPVTKERLPLIRRVQQRKNPLSLVLH